MHIILFGLKKLLLLIINKISSTLALFYLTIFHLLERQSDRRREIAERDIFHLQFTDQPSAKARSNTGSKLEIWNCICACHVVTEAQVLGPSPALAVTQLAFNWDVGIIIDSLVFYTANMARSLPFGTFVLWWLFPVSFKINSNSNFLWTLKCLFLRFVFLCIFLKTELREREGKRASI